MADVPISNLTDATVVNATDEIPIVQGGETKRATITELSAAITPADATTATKGIARLATDADVAAATVTDEIVTPAGLRYGAANETFDEIVIDGATGSSSTGDINIPGEFKINGVAVGIPTATPVAFTGVSSVTITVDFTTYSTYKLDYRINSMNAGSVAIAASSNAGVGYGAWTGHMAFINTPDTEGVDNTNILSDPGSGANVAIQTVHIMQVSTGGNVDFTFCGGHVAQRPCFGAGMSTLTAAANRIKLTFSGSFTGHYILTPLSKR